MADRLGPRESGIDRGGETQHENAMRLREIWAQHDQLREEAAGQHTELQRIHLTDLAPGQAVKLDLGAAGGARVSYGRAEVQAEDSVPRIRREHPLGGDAA